VPVEPLGPGREPAGTRVKEGQPSPDGRYIWRRGEWVPRLTQLRDGATQPPYLQANRYLRGSERAAEVGFRGFLHRWMGLEIRPSSEERHQRLLLEATRTAPAGPQLIAVASRKGGVGKSTLAMLLGSQLCVARKDRVLVLDSNPDSGSLAVRSAHRSPVGAVEIAPHAAGVESYEQLQPYVTVMAQTGLEVLPSLPNQAETGHPAAAPGLAQMARRFFAITLADLGTGVAFSGWWLANADQVVVVATPSLDGVLLAQSTLAQLVRWRGAEWVGENAIVVMNQAGLADPHIRVDAEERDLRSQVRQVSRMGWDPHLAVGGPIDWHQLCPAVRRQTLRIAADLAANFIREGDTS
jgi:MinD-like ATPase involved in chromosome partitioning or flagellar assembly